MDSRIPWLQLQASSSLLSSPGINIRALGRIRDYGCGAVKNKKTSGYVEMSHGHSFGHIICRSE